MLDKKALNWEVVAYKSMLEVDLILDTMNSKDKKVIKLRQHSFVVKEALDKSIRTEQMSDEEIK